MKNDTFLQVSGLENTAQHSKTVLQNSQLFVQLINSLWLLLIFYVPQEYGHFLWVFYSEKLKQALVLSHEEIKVI